MFLFFSHPSKSLCFATLLAVVSTAEAQTLTTADDRSVLSSLDPLAFDFYEPQNSRDDFGPNAELYSAILNYAPLRAFLPAAGPLPAMEVKCDVIDYADPSRHRLEQNGFFTFEFRCKEVVQTGDRTWAFVTLWHSYGKERVCLTRFGTRPGANLEDQGCHSVIADWKVPQGWNWNGINRVVLGTSVLSVVSSMFETAIEGLLSTEIEGRDSGLAGLAINMAAKPFAFARPNTNTPVCSMRPDFGNCESEFQDLVRMGAPIAVLTTTGHGWTSRRTCSDVIFNPSDIELGEFECQVLLEDTDRDVPHLEAWIYTHNVFDDKVAFDLIEPGSNVIDPFGQQWEGRDRTGRRQFTWLAFIEQ